MRFYLTFGQEHVHSINGFTFDKDVVCEINASNHAEAFVIASRNFGYQFTHLTHQKPVMEYYPRGLKALN